MRVLILSKALIVGAYQKKLEALAALPDIDLTVAVPPMWREPRVGVVPLERRFTQGYRFEVLPIRLNGHHHVHYYPTIARLVAQVRPDVFHVDEESFNLATYVALRAGVRYGARCCFYNYANIDRYYPPPFAWFERYAFRHAAHALAANQEAAAIIRRHGYRGPLSVLPQVGVDPQLFAPAAECSCVDEDQRPLVVGYVGRLIAEKGVLDLVEAFAQVPSPVQLRLVGEGDQRERIVERVAQLRLRERVAFVPWTADVPGELRRLDVLVLPSHTTATWKEQFGRILIEAMSCGLVVVGSSSGEIPHVVGDAGLIFPEGDVAALAAVLRRLVDEPALRGALRRQGRARVLERYTQAGLAQQYDLIYRSMVGLQAR